MCKNCLKQSCQYQLQYQRNVSNKLCNSFNEKLRLFGESPYPELMHALISLILTAVSLLCKTCLYHLNWFVWWMWVRILLKLTIDCPHFLFCLFWSPCVRNAELFYAFTLHCTYALISSTGIVSTEYQYSVPSKSSVSVYLACNHISNISNHVSLQYIQAINTHLDHLM